jgi:hypothetical protein
LALFIYPDDGGSMFSRNVGRYIPNYRAFNLTRQYSIPVTLIHTAIRTSNLTGKYNLFFLIFLIMMEWRMRRRRRR